MTDFFEHIDEYKAGSLPVDLKLAFEKELAQNSQLRHAVENYDLLKKISASLIEDETREHIKLLKQTPIQSNAIPKKGIIKNINTKKFIGIAASFFAIFMSLYVIFSNLSTTSEEYVLDMQVKPKKTVVRGTQILTPTKIDSAIILFDDNRYDLAKPLFENNFQSDSLNSLASYYLGHIYLKNKEFIKASAKFESVENHRAYGFKAKYHLVICYISLKDKAKAKKYYDEIKDNRLLGNKDKEKFEKIIK